MWRVMLYKRSDSAGLERLSQRAFSKTSITVKEHMQFEGDVHSSAMCLSVILVVEMFVDGE